MARWRAEALERLPELRDVITSAPRVMALWTEIKLAFQQAYQSEPRNESLIARIYAFADWCAGAPRVSDSGQDPMTAVTLAFYQHIPTFGPAREDMPRWFRYDEVAGNKEIFAYHIGDGEFDALLKHMRKNRGRYQPRRSAT